MCCQLFVIGDKWELEGNGHQPRLHEICRISDSLSFNFHKAVSLYRQSLAYYSRRSAFCCNDFWIEGWCSFTGRWVVLFYLQPLIMLLANSNNMVLYRVNSAWTHSSVNRDHFIYEIWNYRYRHICIWLLNCHWCFVAIQYETCHWEWTEIAAHIGAQLIFSRYNPQNDLVAPEMCWNFCQPPVC